MKSRRCHRILLQKTGYEKKLSDRDKAIDEIAKKDAVKELF